MKSGPWENNILSKMTSMKAPLSLAKKGKTGFDTAYALL